MRPTKRLRGRAGGKNSPKNQERRSYSVMKSTHSSFINLETETDRELTSENNSSALTDDHEESSSADLTSDVTCEMCANSSSQPSAGFVDQNNQLSSLPWRLGTIRAISHRDLDDASLSLMIEFDLLGWQSRDWYNVRERPFDEDLEERSAKEATSVSPGDFSVLLVESSICFLTRQHSPIGKNKLWPALAFEPMIDDLGLFQSSATNLTAIEYFDPDLYKRDNNLMKPNCDIESIMTELETEFSCSINRNSGLLSTIPSPTAVGEHQDDSDLCKCWSPKVEFVDALALHCFSLSKTIETNLKSCTDQPATVDNLSSFKKFIRFCHRLQLRAPAESNHLFETFARYPRLFHTLKDWHTYQDAQGLFSSVCTAAFLVGHRVKVYRSSGTTQWYTAVIISYDERSNQLTLIDDTVLEEHLEDPTLLEMHLIDDELIQSIIEGDVATKKSLPSRRRPQRSYQRQAAQTAQMAIMNSSLSSSVATAASTDGTGLGVMISGAKQSQQQAKGSSATTTAQPSLSLAPSPSSSSSSSFNGGKSTCNSISAKQTKSDNASLAGGGCNKSGNGRSKAKRISASPTGADYFQIGEFDLKSPFAVGGGPEIWSQRKICAPAKTSYEQVETEMETGRRLRRQVDNLELEMIIKREQAKEADGELLFAPPLAVGVASTNLKDIRFGLTKSARSNGKNLMSHRLRLQALESRTAFARDVALDERESNICTELDSSSSSSPSFGARSASHEQEEAAAAAAVQQVGHSAAIKDKAVDDEAVAQSGGHSTREGKAEVVESAHAASNKQQQLAKEEEGRRPLFPRRRQPAEAEAGAGTLTGTVTVTGTGSEARAFAVGLAVGQAAPATTTKVDSVRAEQGGIDEQQQRGATEVGGRQQARAGANQQQRQGNNEQLAGGGGSSIGIRGSGSGGGGGSGAVNASSGSNSNNLAKLHGCRQQHRQAPAERQSPALLRVEFCSFVQGAKKQSKKQQQQQQKQQKQRPSRSRVHEKEEEEEVSGGHGEQEGEQKQDKETTTTTTPSVVCIGEQNKTASCSRQLVGEAPIGESGKILVENSFSGRGSSDIFYQLIARQQQQQLIGDRVESCVSGDGGKSAQSSIEPADKHLNNNNATRASEASSLASSVSASVKEEKEEEEDRQASNSLDSNSNNSDKTTKSSQNQAKQKAAQQQQQTAIFLDSSSIKKASSSLLAPANAFPPTDIPPPVPWTLTLSGHPNNLIAPQIITSQLQAAATTTTRQPHNCNTNQQEHQQTTPNSVLHHHHQLAFRPEKQQTRNELSASPHSLAMHNTGPSNLQQEQTTTKKKNDQWLNNLASLQQQLQQQQLANLVVSPNLQLKQQYGFNPNQQQLSPITSSHSSIASKVDQIIRTTLYDSIHMPNNNSTTTTNMSNSHTTSNSPTPMISNSANLPTPISAAHTSTPSSNARLMSAPSPLASYYGSQAAAAAAAAVAAASASSSSSSSSSIDTLSNLSNKTSAHAASQSALVAAATLQSLNQSHQQRSHQQKPTSARLPPPPPLSQQSSSNRPPSNSPQGPKLGITATTSSDHQNHNHLASLSASQMDNAAEFAARFQQQQQQLKMPAIRHPVSWQQQQQDLANSNGNPRWLYTSPHSTSSPAAFSPFNSNINNLSNSNNMIGQDGDSNQANSMRQKNDRQAFGSGAGSGGGLSQNIDVKAMNSPKQNYQWLVPNNPTDGLRINQPNQRFADELDKDSERLTLFTYNLLNGYIPGTNRLKKVIPLDNEDLRQSIYCQEFYTRFEDIAVGILTNQLIIPDFSIIDYICRDKFTSIEMDRMETVHKRLGLFEILYKIELAQRSYHPSSKANDIKSSSATNSLNFGTGIYQPLFNQQQQQQQLQAMSNSHYSHHLPGKSDNTDKGTRSSQSPSDILSSRSHSSNGPPAPRMLGAHHQNFSSPSLAINNNNNNHLPPPLFAHRGPQVPQARSSPCPMQAHTPFNTLGGIRPSPPKVNGPLGLPPHESPMNMGSNAMIRQPPAAHQSSSARPSVLGLIGNLAHAHTPNTINGPPVSAHMSSKTPQTPRLNHDSFASPVKINLENHSPGRGSDVRQAQGKGYCGLPTTNQHISSKSDLDNMNILPAHVLLGYKQHELVNRCDNALKRVSTPHYPNNGGITTHSNLMGLYPHGMDMARSPGGMDSRINSRSPMNPRLQSSYNPNVPNLSTNSFFKTPPGPNLGPVSMANPMPPPNSDYHHKHFGGPVHDPRSSLASPKSQELQLDQYKALMNACQQQQLMMTSKSSPTLTMDLNSINGPINLPQLPMSSPQSSAGEAMLSEVQQSSVTQHQTPQSKQNQRSIISGSASGPKKGKKIKSSPTNFQATDNNKTSFSPTEANTTTINLSHSANKPLINAELNSGLCNNQVVNNMEEGTQSKMNNDDEDPQQVGAAKRALESLLLSNATCGLYPTLGNSGLQTQPETLDPKNPTASDQSSNNNDASVQRGDLLTTATGTDLLKNIDDHVAKNNEANMCAKNGINEVEDHKVLIEESISRQNKSPTSQTEYIDQSTKNSNITSVIDIKPDDKLIRPLNTGNENNNNNTINSQAAAPISEPSKYQKLYTKKAWLKNYDQEDQARSKDISNQAMVIDKIKLEVEKSEDVASSDTKETRSAPTAKKTKNLRVDSKKKVKAKKRGRDVGKKADSSPPERACRVGKVVYNDSEGSNASTSDLDSDTSNSKTPKTKRLRRMPRRKVKPSSDKDEKSSPKTKVPVKEPPSKKAKKSKVVDVFLQTSPCYDPSLNMPKSIRCLECRKVRQSSAKNDKAVTKQSSKTEWDNFCRFYEFRKLSYNEASQIVVAGFSSMDDAKESDKRLWLPYSNEPPKNISYKVAKFILANVGDEFCNLVKQERDALKSYVELVGEDKKITWKRNVNDTRELCDVCATTLFNCHYVCERCGFVVCIDCYKSRADKASIDSLDESDLSKIKKDSENSVSDKSSVSTKANDCCENGQTKKSKKDSYGWIFCAKNEEHSHAKLILTQIIAGECMEEVWTMLNKTRQRLNLGDATDMFTDSSEEDDPQDEKLSQQVSDAIEGCISALTENCDDSFIVPKDEKKLESSRPVEMITNDDGTFESTTHSWLCNKDLLVLSHAKHKTNIELFRRQWRQGKPVLVRGVDKLMKIDMWLPQFFSNKFGDYRSDLVDCRNGDIHQRSMRKYWDGFEPSSGSTQDRKKSKDDNGPFQLPSRNNEELSLNGPCYYSGSALWRLKDWPPGQDFKDILPAHYEDFMNNLPLKAYTTRGGKLNLACRLPEEMLKPDLGPKMYSAYGTANFPERGTTNLHLDISDAINVMVYVSGASSFQNGSEEQRDTFDKIIDECYVDDEMKHQIRSKKYVPGALWHVFKPSDAANMREFLNKVADERKISLEKRTDPIHDQTWYLDQTLLDRLEKEHGVKSYAILQCMGDAILIPAGAPHQVKNLQNCIKVANDFVSPENVRSCLQLTNEFRSLPETHINQEDKLQIKNILYHSVKESLQFLARTPRTKT